MRPHTARILRFALILVGVGGYVLALLPHIDDENPTPGARHVSVVLGLRSSPLVTFDYHRDRTETHTPGGFSMSASSGMNTSMDIFTWSMLAVVIGSGAIALARRLKITRPPDLTREQVPGP